MATTGIFITFEGGDGAGKTTQISKLRQALESRGHTVVVTREPGGTPLGQEIRELLLHKDYVAPRAEALLYAADRAHNVDTVIRPALERGDVVINDRYFDSSVAYQGAARSLGKDEVLELSLWATNHLYPDLTFLLDIPVEVGRMRVGPEKDRLESAGTEFHEAVRREFLELAANNPERFRVIDGCANVDEIAEEILQHVETYLANR